MSEFYILDDAGNPVKANIATWGRYFDTQDRVVAKTGFINQKVMVSTVFLGLNHQYGRGRPLLFETMVFEASWADTYMERYSTRAEALEGHARAVKWAMDKLLAENPQGLLDNKPIMLSKDGSVIQDNTGILDLPKSTD